MNNLLNILKKPVNIIILAIVVGAIALTTISYRLVTQSAVQISKPARAVVRPPTPTIASTHAVLPSPTPTPIVLPLQDPANIGGVEGNPGTNYQNIGWVRLGHPSCGWGNLRGDTLKSTIQQYHSQGTRVLLTICQANNDNLYDTNMLNDAAQGNADAVQCGNEEMKQDASVSFLYVPPEKFAKFYDLCATAMHTVRPDIPVLFGSLDPHVASSDYQLMVNQVNYLDQVQTAMNTSVHPGGNWNWHDQTLGVIDSWHNGYLGVNNLAGVFAFWAQYFNVDVNGGQLGKHLWVVEGTGCFKGCGINADSPYAVAVSHILTLITDVQTSQQSKVPFFFFSGKDFYDQGVNWPIGILNQDGQAKPIRQDLSMGAKTLNLACPGGTNASVTDQEQLLAKLYAHCTLPADYVSTLTS